MKFVVKYGDLPIGIYNQISKNCVEYTVDKENIKKLQDEGIQLNPIVARDYTGKEFPFLDNRIRNSKRFKNVEIGYHTDPIGLGEIE